MKKNKEIKQEENKKEIDNKKKNEKRFIIVLAVLLVVLAIILLHITIPNDKSEESLSDDEIVEEIQEDNSTKKEETIEESEMTDSDTNEVVDNNENFNSYYEYEQKSKEKIKNTKVLEKVKILEDLFFVGDVEGIAGYNIANRTGAIYSRNFNYESANHAKTYIALNELYSERKPLTEKLSSIYDRLKEKLGNFEGQTQEDIDLYGGAFTEIKVSEFKEKYYELFGTKDYYLGNIGACPRYIYDSQANKFYHWTECGGLGTSRFESYVYNYEETKNKVYVYISVVFINMYVENTKSKEILYSDFEMTNVIERPSEDTLYYINENNYNKFSKFKYTFDHNGTFKSIEKTN